MKKVKGTVVDQEEVRTKVKAMYRKVAQNPKGKFHFELGKSLAQKLGYPSQLLRTVPAGAIDSFAGVGYHIDLAGLKLGEKVVDLGSGSGMDCFVAARQVGPQGRVVGVDMTAPQRTKAERLASDSGFRNVSFLKGYIEDVPAADGEFDVVMSNGVINLSPEKEQVFREAARLLRPGGRLAVSDIITEKPLTQAIVCDVTLWASCIGGAAQRQTYEHSIESAGLEIRRVNENPQYDFLSESARWATGEFGVKSVSVLAVKPA